MNDIKNWALGILGTLLVAAVLGLLNQLSVTSSVRTQMELYGKVIPEPVENALREIREKTNGQAESSGKTQGTVANNTTEISNLKERVTRLENRQ